MPDDAPSTQNTGNVNLTPAHSAGDKVAGDKVAGDKVAGDKVAGDKVAGDKVAGDKHTTNVAGDQHNTQNTGNIEATGAHIRAAKGGQVVIGHGNSVIIQYIMDKAKELLRSPYKLISSYTLRDSHLFFGRDDEIKKVESHIDHHRVFIINGASGSGKTSLVNAGILPRLTENGYAFLDLHEYSDPLEQIRAYLTKENYMEASADASLVDMLNAFAAKEQKRVVLVLDQFERVLINVPSAAKRTAFFDALGDCLATEHKVIIVIRRDKYGYVSAALTSRIPSLFSESYMLNLEALGIEQARSAVIKPLGSVDNMDIDDAFVDTVLLGALSAEQKDAEQQDDEAISPAHLQIVCDALYQAALTKRVEGRNYTITAALYDELGGVSAILNNYLEKEVAKYPGPMPKKEIKHLLYTMVDLTSETRRFVTLADLNQAVPARSSASIPAVLDHLEDRRMIERRRSEKSEEEQETYSITHDLMVGQVKTWFSADAHERKKAQETLKRGLVEWKSPAKALLNERQVQHIRKWLGPLQEKEGGLVDEERTLLDTSETAYEARKRREWRMRRGIQVVAVVATLAAVLAGWQWRVAKKQTDRATRQTYLATAQALTGEVVRQQENYSTDLVPGLLARQAYLFNERYSGDRDALIFNTLQTVFGQPYFRETFGENNRHQGVAVSPDGHWLADGGLRASFGIELWDLHHPDWQADTSNAFVYHDPMYGDAPGFANLNTNFDEVGRVAFTPAGQLASQGSDLSNQLVMLYDLTDHQPKRLGSVRLKPDYAPGSLLYTDGDEMRPDDLRAAVYALYRLNPETPLSDDDLVLAVSGGSCGTVLSPDGRWAATLYEDNPESGYGYNVVDIEDRQRSRGFVRRIEVPSSSQCSLLFDRRGALLGGGGGYGEDSTLVDGYIWIANPETAQVERVLPVAGSRVNHLALSPDGTLLASGGFMAAGVHLWDLQNLDASPLVLPGNSGSDGVAFGPEGRTVYGAHSGRPIQRWTLYDLPGDDIKDWGRYAFPFRFSPDGTLAIKAYSDPGEPMYLYRMEDTWMKRSHVLHQEGGIRGAILADNTSLTLRLSSLRLSSQAELLLEWLSPEDDVTTVSLGTADTLLLRFNELNFIVGLNIHVGARTFVSLIDKQQQLVLWEVMDEGQVGDPIQLPKIGNIDISPDGRHLVTKSAGDPPYTLTLWALGDAPADRPLRSTVLLNKVIVGQFGFVDGGAFLSAEGRGLMHIWDLKAATPTLLGWAGDAHTVASNSTRFISGEYGGKQIVRDLADSTALPIALSAGGFLPGAGGFLPGDDLKASTLMLSPSGRYVSASVRSEDRGISNRMTMMVWDLEQHHHGKAVPIYANEEYREHEFEFVSGQEHLMVVGTTGKLLALPPRMAAQACERAGRNLTALEWATLVSDTLPYECTCPDYRPGSDTGLAACPTPPLPVYLPDDAPRIIPVKEVTCEGAARMLVGKAGHFWATVNEEATAVVTYTWDFGEGEAGTGVLVEHTFEAPGTYTVTVTAANTASSKNATCRVDVLEPPTR